MWRWFTRWRAERFYRRVLAQAIADDRARFPEDDRRLRRGPAEDPTLMDLAHALQRIHSRAEACLFLRGHQLVARDPWHPLKRSLAWILSEGLLEQADMWRLAAVQVIGEEPRVIPFQSARRRDVGTTEGW